ncbi:MAG: hypothetical protein ACE147_14315 [Candidatus Methylomirabilales bacterium]
MTTWLYLAIFVFLNVVVWIGLERINRHLAEITRQLGTAVSLLDQLNQDAAARSKADP